MRATVPGEQHPDWVVMVRADDTVLVITRDGGSAEYESLVQCVNVMVFSMAIAGTVLE